jgi:hypothetical protein
MSVISLSSVLIYLLLVLQIHSSNSLLIIFTWMFNPHSRCPNLTCRVSLKPLLNKFTSPIVCLHQQGETILLDLGVKILESSLTYFTIDIHSNELLMTLLKKEL